MGCSQNYGHILFIDSIKAPDIYIYIYIHISIYLYVYIYISIYLYIVVPKWELILGTTSIQLFEGVCIHIHTHTYVVDIWGYVEIYRGSDLVFWVPRFCHGPCWELNS